MTKTLVWIEHLAWQGGLYHLLRDVDVTGNSGDGGHEDETERRPSDLLIRPLHTFERG
jgi:hypothetical protein